MQCSNPDSFTRKIAGARGEVWLVRLLRSLRHTSILHFMNQLKTPYAVSGSAMDTVIRKSYRKQIIAAAVVTLSVARVVILPVATVAVRTAPVGAAASASPVTSLQAAIARAAAPAASVAIRSCTFEVKGM